MKEVIDQIIGKAGITQEQAAQAYDVILENVKAKLPPSVSGQINNLMEGKAFDYKVVLKERFDALKGETEENVQAFAGEMKERFEDLGVKAEEKFSDIKKDTEGFFRKMFGSGQK
jgi:hypothetical protein